MPSFTASNSGAFTTNYTNDSTFYFIGQGTFTGPPDWTSIIDNYTPGALGTFTSSWTVMGTGGSGKILSVTFVSDVNEYDNKTVTVVLQSGGGTFSNGAGNTYQSPSVACFVEGTHILTQNGYKAIEDLCINDFIITSDKRSIGYKLLKTEIAKATAYTAPYRIQPGAFGRNVPSMPLCLSPTHQIQFREGVWISPQIAASTNPLIKQYGIGEPVNYYHIQCENYLKDNLIANGAVVESYGPSSAIPKGIPAYTWNARLGGYTRLEHGAIATHDSRIKK